MATQYDSALIETFADRLYAQAKSIVIKYTCVFGIVVGLLATALGMAAKMDAAVFGIIGLAVGGYLGYSFAQEKAYQLRLQAQTALCQVQIEKNTRK